MKLKVYETLKKLMQRTTSENDHEALMSLRAANRILASEAPPLTWEKVFNRTVTVVNEVEFDAADAPTARGDARQDLKQLIADAAKASPQSSFVEKMAVQFAEKAWLSKNQIEVLENIVGGKDRREW